MKDFGTPVPRGPAVGSLCQHLQLCPIQTWFWLHGFIFMVILT